MRKVTVKVEVELQINADDDVEIQEVIREMECDFSDTTTKADIVDSTILSHEIVDSR